MRCHYILLALAMVTCAVAPALAADTHGPGDSATPAPVTASARSRALSGDPFEFHPSDCWMGVYSGKTKIGYMHVTVKADKLEGKDVFRKDLFLLVRAVCDGRLIGNDASYTLYATNELVPILGVFTGVGRDAAEPKAPAMRMEMRYGPDTIAIHAQCGEQSANETIPLAQEDRSEIAEGTKCDFGIVPALGGKAISIQHCCFSRIPKDLGTSFGNIRSTVTSLRGEKLELDGTTYDTIVVSEKSKDGLINRWHLPSGEVVKEEIPEDRITIVRESKEKAMDFEPAPVPVTPGPQGQPEK